MSVSKVSTNLFKKMITNGAVNLKNHYAEIDALNVFPVPDGDTGTNMQMTMMSGVRDLNACDSSSISEVGKALSRGLLMGARGNSGVILSQFFRGIYNGLKDIESDTITVDDFINCFVHGSKVAYRAVMQPVEGTILTVVREAAEKVDAKRGHFKDFDELLAYYIAEATKTLERTPELLPVLKEAGVVDSGGAGFIKVVEGMQAAILGKTIELSDEKNSAVVSNLGSTGEVFDFRFPFCTEFIIELKKPETFEEEDLKGPLSAMGDSLVVVKDEDICKVHVHCKKVGKVLDLGQKYGELLTIKIENMNVQANELDNTFASKEETKEVVNYQIDRTNQPKSKYAVIAVCFGDGIQRTFSDLGTDYIIDGGQTMNPPTEDFMTAIEKVNAENVIIIPNNSNVILSAQTAAKLAKDTNVKVIPAKTIAAGYASLLALDTSVSLDKNYNEMLEAIDNVQSGEITYATRDIEMNGVVIKEGEFIGISNGSIVTSTKERLDATKELLEKTVTDDTAIITIFKGKDAPAAESDQVVNYINDTYGVDVELIEGNQDIYSYIIAVE